MPPNHEPDIRAHREAAGLTVRQLAATVGISHGHLVRIEQGERIPAPATLDRLLAAIKGDTVSGQYVKRKAPLIVTVLIARDTWRNLTQPQQAALLGGQPVHPRTAATLRSKRLLRKDGQPTAWGNRVIRWNNDTTGQPQ